MPDKRGDVFSLADRARRPGWSNGGPPGFGHGAQGASLDAAEEEQLGSVEMCLTPRGGGEGEEAPLGVPQALARLFTAEQSRQALSFEESKSAVGGLHFLAVQSGPEATEPEALWLLRHE